MYGSVHSNCTDGEVRLFGGRTEYEGTVEVCLNNAWMTISRTYNSHDYLPKILCRTLGFNISGKVTYNCLITMGIQMLLMHILMKEMVLYYLVYTVIHPKLHSLTAIFLIIHFSMIDIAINLTLV